jgi:lipoprotein-anchoring transpeptidase ErfK/SrfK
VLSWYRQTRLLATAVLLLVLLAPMAVNPWPATAQHESDWIRWSAPSTVYVPATGHSVDGYFLDTWRSWGIASLGNPVTPEITESGRIVQYFEYARMEYWPEDPDGDYVEFGAIGRELKPTTLLRSTAPRGPGDNGPSAATPLMTELLAWLPLTAEDAERPNTDRWQYVPETHHAVQGDFKDYWERVGGVSYLGYPITEEFVRDGVTFQVFDYGQLARTEGQEVREVPAGAALAKRYRLPMEPTPQGDLPSYSEQLFIPPVPPADGERVIDINLSTQYLVAVQGNVVVMESYVSTGKPGFDTPPGTFYINAKLPSQTMAGLLGGEYYNVPDVPWVMYFTDRGHAIHGTYWHDNFGQVMSHGCVNLPLDIAEAMYRWASVGARVVIHW